ncbi:uncharacterized protein LOC135955792 [Calliphora vicina]|uniref:uncharacterized protein LOC135955792 n=1 Tax=Calliphora vicina TaxID=7373 RepID=UPI00325BB902
MLYPKVLIAIFSIAFLNVVFAATEKIEDCDFPCEVNDTKPVCVLDRDEFCFRILPSKCVMERMQCIFEKDYMIYIDMYCELEAFMCEDQPLIQSPPEDSEQEHSESSEDNVDVILKNDHEKLEDLNEPIENVVDLNASEASDVENIDNN